MTTSNTAKSPFEANATASNMCGFTLMNNQVGEVIAEVMRTKDNVRVTALPSMIRVDGRNRIDVPYDEIADSLGALYADRAGDLLFFGHLAMADIDVDPRYGRWDPVAFSVVGLQ